jgi:hypothetical protein
MRLGAQMERLGSCRVFGSTRILPRVYRGDARLPYSKRLVICPPRVVAHQVPRWS